MDLKLKVFSKPTLTVQGVVSLLVTSSFFVQSTVVSAKEANRAQPSEDSSAPAASFRNNLDDIKAEMEIGRSMAGRLIAFYGQNTDKQLNVYLNQVGVYVARAGDFPDRRYMVSVLETDDVNAFACPGGYILLTRGALRHANNEAEIAAVLGHEAAHVGLQHMFNTLRKLSAEEADKLAKESASRKLTDEYGVARKRPEPEEDALASSIVKVLMTANGTGLSLVAAAKAGMSMMMEKGLDQKLEFEADREGVKYAVRAGYDPKALDRFLTRLEKAKEKSKTKTVLDKTHPTIPDRRKVIAEQLNAMDADQITGAVLQARYESFKARLKKPSKKIKERES